MSSREDMGQKFVERNDFIVHVKLGKNVRNMLISQWHKFEFYMYFSNVFGDGRGGGGLECFQHSFQHYKLKSLSLEGFLIFKLK